MRRHFYENWSVRVACATIHNDDNKGMRRCILAYNSKTRQSNFQTPLNRLGACIGDVEL